jgi:RNA polymerase sigma factor (sigma-70 family)
VCVAALEHARDVFALTGCLSPAEEASLRRVFLELIEKQDLWQSIGFELLDLLEEAFSSVKSQALGSGIDSQKHPAGVAFHAANLMSETDCESFLKKARRLKARAVAARNRLIVPNLRLVVSVASKVPRNMLPLDELIQEGNVGLLLAAERFDHRLDFRFSTFAVNLIKARMHRENDNQGRTIRVPVHQAAEIRRLDKVRAELESVLGREVSPAELALETGLKSYELEELSALKAGVVSLHQSKANDGETPLEEFVPDPDTATPFHSKVDLTGKLDVYLMKLEATEREVVCLLYGLGGKPCLGAAETSKFLGLGQAELGRVRKRALEAMRGEILSISDFYAYACAA